MQPWQGTTAAAHAGPCDSSGGALHEDWDVIPATDTEEEEDGFPSFNLLAAPARLPPGGPAEPPVRPGLLHPLGWCGGGGQIPQLQLAHSLGETFGGPC